MLLDSVQADRWCDCLYNTLLKEAPTPELKELAEQRWGDVDTWRFVARAMAELNPTLLRNGDLAAWVMVSRQLVADYYYELQKPAERLQHEDKPLPWIERLYAS